MGIRFVVKISAHSEEFQDHRQLPCLPLPVTSWQDVHVYGMNFAFPTELDLQDLFLFFGCIWMLLYSLPLSWFSCDCGTLR